MATLARCTGLLEALAEALLPQAAQRWAGESRARAARQGLKDLQRRADLALSRR